VVHPTPEPRSPITIIEPSVEPKKREKRAPVGTRLDTAWEPSASDLAYAADKGVDAQVEGESFKDHWLADTTQKAVKADWAAAWRTWVRNSIKYARPQQQRSPQKSFRERDLEAARDEASRWTGGRLGSKRTDPNTIDMEATYGPLTAID
jgi:hypothetical protein